jgi:hypothetical protein
LIGEHGFDFGIELNVLLVTNLDFIDLLKKAEIFGCAYGVVPKGPLGVPMREISLVGRNADGLQKAFAEFHQWANFTDGDAVDITLIFLKDGGYLFCIGRDRQRAICEFRRSKSVLSPIVMEGSYVKKFDTRDPALQEFREYKSKLLISPFLFGAAAFIGDPAKLSAPHGIQRLSVEPILKFEIRFLDEEDIKPGTFMSSLLTRSGKMPRRKRKHSLSTFGKPRQPTPVEISRHRTETLETHFPVTIERLRSGRFPEVVGIAGTKGLREWQIEQAVCNLLLSESLCNGEPFYRTLAPEEFTTKLALALGDREENSNTPIPSRFAIETILTQVRLDGFELLRAVGSLRPILNVESLQQSLRDLGLLEPYDA